MGKDFFGNWEYGYVKWEEEMHNNYRNSHLNIKSQIRLPSPCKICFFYSCWFGRIRARVLANGLYDIQQTKSVYFL